jgi:hypothetical protein
MPSINHQRHWFHYTHVSRRTRYAKGHCVRLLFLPTYRPRANPIERVRRCA